MSSPHTPAAGAPAEQRPWTPSTPAEARAAAAAAAPCALARAGCAPAARRAARRAVRRSSSVDAARAAAQEGAEPSPQSPRGARAAHAAALSPRARDALHGPGDAQPASPRCARRRAAACGGVARAAAALTQRSALATPNSGAPTDEPALHLGAVDDVAMTYCKHLQRNVPANAAQADDAAARGCVRCAAGRGRTPIARRGAPAAPARVPRPPAARARPSRARIPPSRAHRRSRAPARARSAAAAPAALRAATLVPRLSASERWWGGVVARGVEQPYGEDTAPWRLALGDTDYNQANPVLISTHGRYIWADDVSAVVASTPDGGLRIEHAPGAHICVGAAKDGAGAASGLRGAFAAASAAHFAPSGRAPASALLASPQYNLWMESNLDRANEPTQAKVMAYADAVLAHGFPPGVLMIDTNWAEHYGSFRFHMGRFPDPRAMCAALHGKGFQVAVWVSPFVSPDSETFRAARHAGHLVRHAGGTGVALAEWWDGYSALVDFTNPEAAAWFAAGLERVRALGVDGFKFDGGDPPFYADADVASAGGADCCAAGGAAWCSPAHTHCEAFARFGTRYELLELRACWKARARRAAAEAQARARGRATALRGRAAADAARHAMRRRAHPTPPRPMPSALAPALRSPLCHSTP
jgi:hypothetical protein